MLISTYISNALTKLECGISSGLDCIRVNYHVIGCFNPSHAIELCIYYIL